MRVTALWFWIVMVCLVRPLSAQAEGGRESFYLGGGAILSNLYRTSGFASGSLKTIGAAYTHLQFSAHYPWGSWNWVPAFSGTPLGVSDSDDSVSKRIFLVQLGLEKETPVLDIKAGIGMRLFNQIGKGGTVVLNNGNSTSTFARPAFNSTARNLVVDLGLGQDMISLGSGNVIRFDLDFIGTSVASSRRAIDVVATLSWGWI